MLEYALDEAERAIELWATTPHAWWIKSRCLEKLELFDPGLKAARKASELAEADALDVLRYGQVCERFDEDGLVPGTVARLHASAPDSLPARSAWLSLLLAEDRGPASLLRAAEGVLEIDDLNALGLYARGYARLWDGKPGDAVRDLELSLGLEQTVFGWWYLAVARHRAGDGAAAAAAFDRYRAMLVEMGETEARLVDVDRRIAEVLAEPIASDIEARSD